MFAVRNPGLLPVCCRVRGRQYEYLMLAPPDGRRPARRRRGGGGKLLASTSPWVLLKTRFEIICGASIRRD